MNVNIISPKDSVSVDTHLGKVVHDIHSVPTSEMWEMASRNATPKYKRSGYDFNWGELVSTEAFPRTKVLGYNTPGEHFSPSNLRCQCLVVSWMAFVTRFNGFFFLATLSKTRVYHKMNTF